ALLDGEPHQLRHLGRGQGGNLAPADRFQFGHEGFSGLSSRGPRQSSPPRKRPTANAVRTSAMTTSTRLTSVLRTWRAPRRALLRAIAPRTPSSAADPAHAAHHHRIEGAT